MLATAAAAATAAADRNPCSLSIFCPLKIKTNILL
jgi:hypothetical protein